MLKKILLILPFIFICNASYASFYDDEIILNAEANCRNYSGADYLSCLDEQLGLSSGTASGAINIMLDILETSSNSQPQFEAQNMKVNLVSGSPLLTDNEIFRLEKCYAAQATDKHRIKGLSFVGVAMYCYQKATNGRISF